MANLLYRASVTPVTPATTTAKDAPLTNLEVDGNFKSLNDELVLKAPLASPTFTGDVAVDSTTSLKLPTGTTAERPETPASGQIRYNSTLSIFEGYGDAAWLPISNPVVADDTATDATFYPALAAATSGTPTTLNVSSTKLTFNPSTGTLGATIFNSLSDVTLKSNVKTIENASSVVANLNGVEFTWNDNNKKSAGVVAQEIEKVLPHLVETDRAGVKSVNYSGIIAYLIEMNKELLGRIEKLESK